MIKHILKIMWNQRRSNGWIFAELLIVACVLWMMTDAFWVDNRTYHAPLGFDIENVWRFKLSKLDAKAPGYVADSLYHSSDPEDLTQLMTQIRQNPEVEDVCVTFYSCPYSNGNSWREVKPVDGDTVYAHNMQTFQLRNVTPEYFRLFRIRTADGEPVYDKVAGKHNVIVITPEMAEGFYHGAPNVVGRRVYHGGNDFTSEIAAVSASIRSNDYERPEACYFQCLEGELYNSTVSSFGASSAEFCVRMKHPYTQDEMNRFLDGMEERLTVNNLYVYGISPISSFRDRQMYYYDREANNKMSLMAFMLVNVFFGIIGTFWLRMQNRKGEIGLRMALGAHRITLKRYMYTEGLCLLALTLPLVILFAFNMVFMDKLDTYRQPLSLVRFGVTFGITYLMMAAMICVGIWFPVRKAVRTAPAEALHYE
ncbi:FtsX-like permease family protein [uncultured Parabacteroides sp.]|uniref:ABC transporter permease n=1 Tax=uncultured Parabacteroides sp. TaxID=512312 RepID=UPI0026370B4E|nr:FtsX-like permease family protein [uncultured Parabacteroides sp.]